MEGSYGPFQRTVPIFAAIGKDKLDAQFENGVLTVLLPKTKEAQKETKNI